MPAVRAKLDWADFHWKEKPLPETVSTGIRDVDSLTGGLPRGCLSEICGTASSGRTSLLVSVMAEATAREEVCALVDANDAFDPASAATAGIDLNRLLWVRCAGNMEHALQATDLLVQGGGFGLIVMDLADAAPQEARRISLASWYRLRRAVENTPTVLLVLDREPNAKSCASLFLEMRRDGITWSGAPGCSQLLRSMLLRVEPRKPVRSAAASFEARAVE